MNKIKRAIIMAAGIGSRMNPITLNTPKPLVKVNGKVMIESIIEALHYYIQLHTCCYILIFQTHYVICVYYI